MAKYKDEHNTNVNDKAFKISSLSSVNRVSSAYSVNSLNSLSSLSSVSTFYTTDSVITTGTKMSFDKYVRGLAWNL